MSAVAAKPKFPRRRDGFYHLDGRKYVGVTEVLSTIAKPALIHWAGKTASALVLNDPEKYDTAEKAMAGLFAARESAGDRGKTIHSWIEAYMKGAPLVVDDVPYAFQGYARAFTRWVSKSGLQQSDVIATEANIYSDKHGYAGTTDLIATIGGQTMIVDFKSSKDGSLYPEVGLQMVAYEHGDFILTKDDPPRRIEVPKADCTLAVGLGANGEVKTQLTDAPLEVFLALKRVYEWQRGER